MLKTVQVVVMVWSNPTTGESTSVRFNADDGALNSYTGPGPGWQLVSREVVTEQQLDFGDQDTYDSIYNPQPTTSPFGGPAAGQTAGGLRRDNSMLKLLAAGLAIWWLFFRTSGS